MVRRWAPPPGRGEVGLESDLLLVMSSWAALAQVWFELAANDDMQTAVLQISSYDGREDELTASLVAKRHL